MFLTACPPEGPTATPNPNIVIPGPNGAPPPNPNTTEPAKIVPQDGGGEWWFYPAPGHPGFVWMYDPIKKVWYLYRLPKNTEVNEVGTQDVADFVDEFAIADMLPPDMEASAEDLLDAAELTGSAPFTGVMGVLGGGEFDLGTMSGTLDVRIPMRSDFNIPMISAYNLKHELYCVASEDPENHNFWTIRVAGDAVDVAHFLADSGFTSMSLPFRVAEFTGVFYVTINEDREVYLGEEYLDTLPPPLEP